MLIVWYGILKSGKKPIIHMLHWSALSIRISSNICSLFLTYCLGSGSSVNIVIELETLTLSAHVSGVEIWGGCLSLFMVWWGSRVVF
jgi:hypothetical protein